MLNILRRLFGLPVKERALSTREIVAEARAYIETAIERRQCCRY